MYKQLIRPLLFKMDPESAHNMTLAALRMMGAISPLASLIRQNCTLSSPILEQELFGLHFPNPVGLAAGLDKAGAAPRGWEALGFGFIEHGAVTPKAQEGNPCPRVFRLVPDEALINRMGFNNPGAQAVEDNLFWNKTDIPIGINIGKQKNTPIDNIKAVREDYLDSFGILWSVADFFVANVSSPNTPGLRSLQSLGTLCEIMRALDSFNRFTALQRQTRPKPILVKIAPDLANEDIQDIANRAKELRIDGLVATNTTEKRPASLKSPHSNETGGLSGPPLRLRALEVVRLIRSVNPEIPIVGVGGISTGEHAYEMLVAGANLIQVCTGLIYEGPALPKRINLHLRQKFLDVGKVVGSLHPHTIRN